MSAQNMTPKGAQNTDNKARTVAVTGVLAGVAFILQLLEFPVPMFMPPFIKFDFSDLPALVGAFALGPVCGIAIEFVKNLIHVMFSGSFAVGELSNFLLGAVFVGVAGFIYKKNKTKSGALIASLAGAVAMALASLPFNYFVVYPVYYNFMPEETILAAYQVLIPSMKSIFQSLLCFNVPFTFNGKQRKSKTKGPEPIGSGPLLNRGAYRARTCDLSHVKRMLSQLS